MGLLSEGRPLSWEETKKCAPMVQKLAALQFLRIYHREKDRNGDKFKWGDEVKSNACMYKNNSARSESNEQHKIACQSQHVHTAFSVSLNCLIYFQNMFMALAQEKQLLQLAEVVYTLIQDKLSCLPQFVPYNE